MSRKDVRYRQMAARCMLKAIKQEISAEWHCLPTAATGRQSLNASPVKPSRQPQTGEWLTTRQFALGAHDPGQGSTHFWLMQVRSDWQSELTVHSGRQLGALPIIFGMQEHCACPDTTWHCELAPQGGGLQGLGGSGDGVPSSTTGLGTGSTNDQQHSSWVTNLGLDTWIIGNEILLTGNYATTSQRITSVSWRTNTDGIVANNSAFWISSTSSFTRILAFEIEASLGWTAFRVGNAFRPTFWWNTQIARLTRANRWTSNRPTNTIGATRCGVAGLLGHTRWGRWTLSIRMTNWLILPYIFHLIRLSKLH